MLWVLSSAVLFEADMIHRQDLSFLAVVTPSQSQLPHMRLCSHRKQGPVLVFSWPGKVQATFPITQPLTSCVACSVPVPLGLPPLQLFPPFPEYFLSLWTSFSLNQLIFPGSCSHLLPCFLISTLHLCPACPLTSNWNVGQGHPGSAPMFCGQCWWQNGFSLFQAFLEGHSV